MLKITRHADFQHGAVQ